MEDAAAASGASSIGLSWDNGGCGGLELGFWFLFMWRFQHLPYLSLFTF